jgi:outer membrane protein assembly factor BamB
MTPSAAMHGFDKKTGRLLWRYKVAAGVVSSVPYKRGEATITSSPVIVKDVVYFGANDGVLHAVDVNSGKLLWQYRLGVPIASTVAVTGNTVVVAAWDGTVYAFTATE